MAIPGHYHENIYLNEIVVDRTSLFGQNKPWTSSPILSALVFITVSTLVVFYIQARSLTRNLRPANPGVHTHLSAAMISGLLSLHSQPSHAQAQSVQPHGLVHLHLGCNSSSQAFLGLSSDLLEPISDITAHGQFSCFNAAYKHQLSGRAPQIVLSQIGDCQSSQQIRFADEVTSSGTPTKDDLQAVYLTDALGKYTANSSGLLLLYGQRLLTIDVAKIKRTPDLHFIEHLQPEKQKTSENIESESFFIL